MGKNWKKAIAGTLSACLLATCVPERTEFGDFVQTNEVVQAATTKNAISGKCGKKATWKYNTKTKTLTISGSGEMYAYTVYTWYENAKNESPWAAYIKEIKKVVVGNKITEIGEYAFYGCTSLKTVSLGKNIKKIQDSAFYGATALEKINLGDKVEKIDYSAFYDCKSLKSLNIGKSVKTINSSALAGCSGLKTIKVSSKNKYFKMKNNSLINKQGTQWYGGCFVTDSTCRINEKIEKIDTGAMERNSSIENIKVSSKNKTFSSKDGLLYLQNGKELFICPQGKKGTVVVQEKTTVIGGYGAW